MGAGIMGVSTAWFLLQQGHEVVVIDRQPEAARETSYANGAQISVSYCEPWAQPGMPFKVLKWLLHDDSPILFRPRLDPHQWRWALRFLGECTSAAFVRNVTQLVALGRYSQETLRRIVDDTGIAFDRVERGILHFFASERDLELAAAGAALMRRHGVNRELLSREALLRVEPALAGFVEHIAGGTYTASDESGDARVFTQQLALRAAQRGAEFLYDCDILDLDVVGGAVRGVRIAPRPGGAARVVQADAVVAALGSYTAPLLARHGVDLCIYPVKGYSVTLPLRVPERASVVSMIDDARKIAISRLGPYVRVAGTAEMAGYDVGLDSPTARVRLQALVDRYEAIFPGVADTRAPVRWAGLRPSTPNNVPYIGRTPLSNLWVNAGHGTLGWTHGAGSGRALAEWMSGERPELDFRFYGMP